jgi:hypothetical protein
MVYLKRKRLTTVERGERVEDVSPWKTEYHQRKAAEDGVAAAEEEDEDQDDTMDVNE